jgi:hypothetical protein
VRTTERTKVKYGRYQYAIIVFLWRYEQSSAESSIIVFLWRYGQSSAESSITLSLNSTILMYRSTLFSSVPRRAFGSHSSNGFLARLHLILLYHLEMRFLNRGDSVTNIYIIEVTNQSSRPARHIFTNCKAI